MTRREFIGGAAVAALAASQPARGGRIVPASTKTLPNGIVLPDTWPPRGPATREPMSPPYLTSPPEVIPIDGGRQLFVDDFLVERTTMQRAFHSAAYHPASPVIVPDKPWEQEGKMPCAMVFSDGVWWEPREKRYHAWYLGGYCMATCHAVSDDGLHWEKPAHGIRPGTNVVHTENRDSNVVWLDHYEKDPARRYKLYNVGRHARWALRAYTSPDGVHWSEMQAERAMRGDRTTVFYNPFRKVWVASLREQGNEFGRYRCYYEHPDPIRLLSWKDEDLVQWVGADRLDPERSDLQTRTELYNLDVVAYESLLIGLFSIWYGQRADRPKPNQLLLGFSRDGFHWSRPSRVPFMPVSEDRKDWNWGNIQSAGGGCVVVGDQLRFYCSGRRSDEATPEIHTCVTGLATLRRDGSASMDAGGSEAELVTRPIRFTGKRLFVNADAAGGELRVEVLDRDGQPIAPLTAEACEPIRTDGTLLPVRWKRAVELTRLAGQPVRLRFRGRRARLYAFWVSRGVSGASDGYVAAGGPGFAGPTDAEGAAAYRAAK